MTAEEVDAAIVDLGTRSLVPVADLPPYIDTKGMRIIIEEVHEGAIWNPGRVMTYVPYWDAVDALLDLRNEISPPPPSVIEED